MLELFEIPLVNSEPRFKIRTILDEIEVILKVDWNDRAERFQLSVYDANENALVEGMTMNVDSEIMNRYTIEGLPKGMLILYDTSKTHTEAGLEDLGDRCKLIYQSAL